MESTMKITRIILAMFVALASRIKLAQRDLLRSARA